MRKINLYIYPIYCLAIFIASFIVLYPFFLLFVQHRKLHTLGHWTNRIWGYIVFFLCGIKYTVVRHMKPDKGQVYIYCANHSSYADIPSIYSAVLHDINFIGKESLKKVPLFGYMYAKLHILVNRKSSESKKRSVELAKQRLDEGTSIVIFPEGTIPKTNNPKLIEFKDGAFKIAIEKQIPIVPVTLPYNYILLPDHNKMQAKRHECKVIIHSPISTRGLTQTDIPKLKEEVFKIIESELINHNVYPKKTF